MDGTFKGWHSLPTGQQPALVAQLDRLRLAIVAGLDYAALMIAAGTMTHQTERKGVGLTP